MSKSEKKYNMTCKEKLDKFALLKWDTADTLFFSLDKITFLTLFYFILFPIKFYFTNIFLSLLFLVKGLWFQFFLFSKDVWCCFLVKDAWVFKFSCMGRLSAWLSLSWWETCKSVCWSLYLFFFFSIKLTHIW